MKDKNHITMEDISAFPIERSTNHINWEEIAYQEVKEQILEELEEDKLKCFIRSNASKKILTGNILSIIK